MNNFKHKEGPMIREVANEFKLGEKKIFYLLKRYKIFSGILPRNEYVISGHFSYGHGFYTLPSGAGPKLYTVAIVNEKGKKLIQDLINHESNKLDRAQILHEQSAGLPDQHQHSVGQVHLQRLEPSERTNRIRRELQRQFGISNEPV